MRAAPNKPFRWPCRSEKKWRRRRRCYENCPWWNQGLSLTCRMFYQIEGELIHGLVLSHNPLSAPVVLGDGEQFLVRGLVITGIAAFASVMQDTQGRRIFPLH